MILYQYPKNFVLKEDVRITIRPVRKSDENLFLDYFACLPLKDRLCFSEDFTKAKTVKNWIMNLDYNETLPLVAINADKIVGNANLIYSPIGWVRHQGKIQVTCDPAYREKGLSKLLLENLVKIAKHTGLEQLAAEIPMSLKIAHYIFEHFGFCQTSVLEGFVKDMNGEYDDLVLMIKNIHTGQEIRTASDADSKRLVIPMNQHRIHPPKNKKRRVAL